MIFTSFAFANHTSAQGILDKRISLTVKGQLLKDVLHQITETNGVNIVFTGNEIFNTQRVTISASALPLKKVLSKLLSPYSLTYKVVDNNILIKRSLVITSHKINAIADTLPEQPKSLTVTGKITDAIGNALGGVSIRVKGAPHGTLSNSVGFYTIQVNSDDSIQFSFIGYVTQTWSAKNRVTLNVIMEAQENSLNEVVVTGYGQEQTALSVTSAVSTVRTKELKQSPVANLSNALAGRLPGLTSIQNTGLPGSDGARLYIRGLSTFAGTQTPLVVIDGLPLGDANFGDMDPNEVESISILKDAASTSLYGVQGANGVILVTTRRGKIGKPTVQLNAQTGQERPTALPSYLNSYQSALLDNEGAVNDTLPPVWTAAALNAMQNNTDPYTYPDVNWWKVMLKPYSPQSQFNVNISGGNDQVTYFVSGSYLHQGSLVVGSNNNQYGVGFKYDRYNFRSNINVNITKTLKLRLDLASRLEDRQSPGPGYAWIFTQLSHTNDAENPIYNPDGTYAAGNKMTTDNRNILGNTLNGGYSIDDWNSTNGTVEATQLLDFVTPGLSLKGMFTFQNYGENIVSQTQDFTSYRFSQDPVTGVQTYTPFSTATSLSSSNTTSSYRYYYYDVELNYDRKFGKSNVGAMFLGNRTYTSVAVSPYLPHVYQGLVGQATYDYDKRYFLQANFGYNGSENFPPGKRYGFFPAVSGGWVISNEKFYHIHFMDYLKLRGSYGLAGNDQTGASRWMFLSSYVPASGAAFGATPVGSAGYTESQLGNPNVTWEKSHKADIGLELGFLKSAVKLTADYFHELRTNILTRPQTLPDYTGANAVAVPINLGKVVNRGVEFDLKLNTYIHKVNIFADLNYSLAKDKILYADEPIPAYPYQYYKGHPIGYALGYVADGLFQSKSEIASSPIQTFAADGGLGVIPGDIKYKDLNGDGVINSDDEEYIPHNNFPTQNFGFSVGFSVAGFDLSILFSGALGGEADYSGFFGNPYQYSPYEYDHRWTPETASTAIFPSTHKANWNNDKVESTYWLYSADYLKLRNLEIGYTLPSTWARKVGLSKVRFFVNGQNLVTWDKLPLKNIDPELDPNIVTSGTNNYVPYPIEKVFNAGVTVNL
ncbi:MAG: TonB-dependent receptor [Arachidicoccus sp.]|nr:TonB-dependent receptor [Arachidicoccus sp.]